MKQKKKSMEKDFVDQKKINQTVRQYYEDLFGDYEEFDQVMWRLSACRLIGLDFDGTITVKGHVLVREDGREYIIRSRKDSLLIPALNKAGVTFVVISTEENPAVKATCTKMNIEYYQGIQTGEGKLDILLRKAKEMKLHLSEIAFMGDDINDLACLSFANVAFCPADSHILVKEAARRRGFMLTAEGGNGALRQLTELLLIAKGLDIKR